VALLNALIESRSFDDDLLASILEGSMESRDLEDMEKRLSPKKVSEAVRMALTTTGARFVQFLQKNVDFKRALLERSDLVSQTAERPFFASPHP